MFFDINSDEILLYKFSNIVAICGGSCNSIDDPYALVFVPNKVKNMNVKVFHLILWVNETKRM